MAWKKTNNCYHFQKTFLKVLTFLSTLNNYTHKIIKLVTNDISASKIFNDNNLRIIVKSYF